MTHHQHFCRYLDSTTTLLDIGENDSYTKESIASRILIQLYDDNKKINIIIIIYLIINFDELRKLLILMK